jgi:InsA N-terminal domain
MIMQVLHCPNCQGTDIVRHGKTRQGQQRYRCREQHCAGRTWFCRKFAFEAICGMISPLSHDHS